MGAAGVTVAVVVVEDGDRHQLQPSTRFYCFRPFFPSPFEAYVQVLAGMCYLKT